MGLSPILPVKLSDIISTMLNSDGNCDGDGNGVGTCEQKFVIIFTSHTHWRKYHFVRATFDLFKAVCYSAITLC